MKYFLAKGCTEWTRKSQGSYLSTSRKNDPRSQRSVAFVCPCWVVKICMDDRTAGSPADYPAVNCYLGRDESTRHTFWLVRFWLGTKLKNINYTTNLLSSYSVIVQVRVVLKRTVVGDWRFDKQCGRHLQSQVKNSCKSMMLLSLVCWTWLVSLAMMWLAVSLV